MSVSPIIPKETSLVLLLGIIITSFFLISLKFFNLFIIEVTLPFVLCFDGSNPCILIILERRVSISKFSRSSLVILFQFIPMKLWSLNVS